MESLSPGYYVEVDKSNRSSWTKVLLNFADANINQSWSYGAIRWNTKNLSHLILKRNGKIAAAAQLRIVRPFGIGRGMAYVSWGPMWQPWNAEHDLLTIQNMFRALKNEYISRRRLYLRIRLNIFDIDSDFYEIKKIIEREGFIWKPSPYRTFLVDLKESTNELRKNISSNWRKKLNKAERNDLNILAGNSDELFKIVSELYNEMLIRKNFKPAIHVNEFRAIQKDLPQPLKMRIMICEHQEEPIGALVGSALGKVGIELVAATGKKGLTQRGAYLLRWQMLQWLKAKGCRYYDLGGIDPEGNPGTYQFKSGFAGKSGKDTHHLGEFEACKSACSYFLVKLSEQKEITAFLKRKLNKKVF